MRFQQYINETVDPDDVEQIWEAIEKDCKPFLKEARKAKRFLWRGAHGNDTIEKLSPRKERKPRFIPIELHQWLDKTLKDLFGWKPRSEGLFTAGLDVARNFGPTVRMIFPIGRFKYIAMDRNNLGQLYNYYDRFDYYVSLDGLEAVKKDIYNIIKKYETKGLWKFLKENEYECILNCKTYYSVHQKWHEFLIGKL